MTVDAVIYVRLSEIRFWPLNPKKEHDIVGIKRAIQRHGFPDTVALFHGELRRGEGRTRALLALKADGIDPATLDGILVDDDGEWLVPAISLDHMDEQQANTYGVSDNVLARRGQLDHDHIKRLIKRGQVEVEQTALSPKQIRRVNKKLTDLPFEVTGRSIVADVPDARFPCEPEFDIPLLDIDMQAEEAELPFIKWGSIRRTAKHDGTVHFYTDDAKFRALVKNPLKVVDTECLVAVEPNFTTHSQMARALVLERVYQKRYMARLWQSRGIRVLVDLNVSVRYREDNLYGVPKGWGAYCTRALAGQEHYLEEEYALVAEFAGKPPTLFVVYGGNESIKAQCARRGWVWIPEYKETIHGR